MRSAPIVECPIAGYTAPRLRETSVGTSGDFLVLNRPPGPFEKDIVALNFLAAYVGRKQK